MFKFTPEKYEKIKDILISAIFILLVILIFALFKSTPDNKIGSQYYNSEKLTDNADNTEVLRDETEATFKELEKCREEFEQPIDVVWEGEVIGFMYSGACYAIRKIPAEDNYPYETPKFMACLPKTDYTGIFYKGRVKITGKWTGIFDYYANAFFNHTCAPYVEEVSIEGEYDVVPIPD